MYITTIAERNQTKRKAPPVSQRGCFSRFLFKKPHDYQHYRYDEKNMNQTAECKRSEQA
jgi:hypothetical protein